MNSAILLINALSTWFMLGLIWIIQIVHYPLFHLVDPNDANNQFKRYQETHVKKIKYIVGPVMFIEAVTSLLLVFNPPSHSSPEITWIGICLVAIIFLSTALLQVPLHNTLGSGYQENTCTEL